MATTIVMPKMGYDMREGTVVRWYKQEGEEVARGEVIADIETDKATVEFEAYTGGVLHRRVAQEGVAVPVGDAIAIIAEPRGGPGRGSRVKRLPLPRKPPSLKQPRLRFRPSPVPPARQDGEVRASPIARRLARERGIDLTLVVGTGPGGRIVEKDVLEYVPSGDDAPPNGWIKASPLARRLARERGIDLAQVVGTGPGGRVVEQDVLAFTRPTDEIRDSERPTPYITSAQPSPPVATPPQAEAEALPGTDRVELSRMRQAIARVTVDSKQQAPHFYVTADIDMDRAMDLRREINDALPAEARVSVNDLVVRGLRHRPGPAPQVQRLLPGRPSSVQQFHQYRHSHFPGIGPDSARYRRLRQ